MAFAKAFLIVAFMVWTLGFGWDMTWPWVKAGLVIAAPFALLYAIRVGAMYARKQRERRAPSP